MSSGVVLDSKADLESLKSGSGYLAADASGFEPLPAFPWSLLLLNEIDESPLGENFAGARDLHELPIERLAKVDNILLDTSGVVLVSHLGL
jgi:hypothetical protein